MSSPKTYVGHTSGSCFTDFHPVQLYQGQGIKTIQNYFQSSSTKIVASRRVQSTAIATAEPFKLVDLSLGHFALRGINTTFSCP